MAAVRIESPSLPRHLDQHLGGRKTRRSVRIQPLEGTYYTLGAKRIDVAEWAAAEWRKADTENGAHVAIARGS